MILQKRLDVEELLDMGCSKESFTLHRFNITKLLNIDTIPRVIKITNSEDPKDYIIAEGHTEVVEMMKTFRNKFFQDIYENETKQLMIKDMKTIFGMISRNLIRGKKDRYFVELKYWN